MTCSFEHLDASYLLGGLAETERGEFEVHLADCSRCQAAVLQLAGIPGLLTKVPDQVWSELPENTESAPIPPLPVPDVRPGLRARVDRERRTRRRLLVGTAAASAALLFGAGTLLVSQPWESSSQAQHDPTAGSRMTAVGHSSMVGWLDLRQVHWGTRLALNCEYGEQAHSGSGPDVYTLVVRDRSGSSEQVASWQALDKEQMKVVGSTATELSDIASVEVHDAHGVVLLRLTR